ncbi:HAMP domain-containing histidine kinase [Geovibrio thiophilus]|uniref:HAMP domain-containing histidine kinase n=1 Tax=Geovibrio thiophilus TaxID=139438 RepID=A0A3R5UW47_9BACT|nr:HAMP domain-containing histidine kinase [Geovibrio thiophilus]QAR34142.1 HAMP domain-containing histidine kinase [Geovibrio thiophilus]
MSAGEKKGISLRKLLAVNCLILVLASVFLILVNYFLNYRNFELNVRGITAEAVRMVDENIGYYKEFQSPANIHVRLHMVDDHKNLHDFIAEYGIPSYEYLMNRKKEHEEELNTEIEIALLTGKGVIFNTTYPTELGLDISRFPNAMETLRRAKEKGGILLDYPVYERSGRVLRAYTMSYIKERDIYLQTALFLADLKVVRERLEKIVALSEYIKSVDAILVFNSMEGGSNLIFNISSDEPETDTDSEIVLETLKRGEMTEKTSGSLFTGTSKSYYVIARVPDSAKNLKDLDHRIVYRIIFDTTDERRYGILSFFIKLFSVAVAVFALILFYRRLNSRFVIPFGSMIERVKRSEKITEKSILAGEKDLARLAELYNGHRDRQLELLSYAEKFNEELEERVRLEVSKGKANEQLIIRQSMLATMGEMTHSVAYLWQLPLRVLGEYVESISSMAENFEENRDRLEKIASDCMEQVLYMSSTIEGLRDFFRPSLEKKLFDLRQTLEDTMRMVAPHMLSGDIRLSFTCRLQGYEEPVRVDVLKNLERCCGAGYQECVPECPGFGFTVCGFPAEFKLAVLSVFHNSKRLLDEKRSMETDGFEPLIDVDLYDEGEAVRIRIRDNSGGMSAADLNAVNDPYSPGTADNMRHFNLYMAVELFRTIMSGKVDIISSADGLDIDIYLDKNTSACGLEKSVPK